MLWLAGLPTSLDTLRWTRPLLCN